MSDAGQLAVQQMCAMAGVSRAGYYRGQVEPTVEAEAMGLRDAIQKIAVEWPSYGSRRMTEELRGKGWEVNRKRVQRIMRQDNLLCLRRRRFVVTTDSKHGFGVYPNLAADLEPSAIDQLWVADITYVRLQDEFIYLAVMLDAFSRRVVGWALDRTLETSLTLAALDMALEQRRPGPGLVHHSDRGVQYASGDYTARLRENDVLISMSRRGNPYDNAQAESFMKTLKYEEVYRTEYRDLAHARQCLRQFIERVYNRKRLHSAIGYRSPVQFERELPAKPPMKEAPPPAGHVAR